ncbi:MAG: nucleoside phosphorylase [Thermoproteus sp.]|nr:nucleoside phosphorylase [Thermoproteus sp.]
MPYHIRARPEDVGDVVVGVGDPARAELFARAIGGRLVNAHRYPVYTGLYNGKRISVVGHGIGGPSISIALEELRQLGMEKFVRIGTAGSLGELKPGDLVVASSAIAAKLGGIYSAYMGDSCPPLAPDPLLTAELYKALRPLGARLGPVVSSDAFYSEGAEEAAKWRSWGALAVEMECAAAMMLGWIRKFRVGCALVISNVVGRHEAVDLSERFLEVFKRVLEVVGGSSSSPPQ